VRNRDARLRLLAQALIIYFIGTLFRIVTLGFVGMANNESLSDLLGQWDAGYYLAIAEKGYFAADLKIDGPVHHRTLAFFPGFPALIRLVHELTGLEMAGAAALVNLAAGVAMTAGAVAIAERMGAGRAGRLGAGVLVSSAPMSITFAMPYTEAVFGALAFWSIVALLDRRWGIAAALIFLLGFTRLTAVAVIFVFGLVVLLRARRDWRAWTCLALTPWSLLGYVAWASWHGRGAGGYFGIQEAGWRSGFDFGAATLRWVWKVLTTSGEAGYLLSVGVMVAAVVALVAARGRMPWEVWWFAAVLSATVLLSDGIMHSRPRLLLPAVILLLPWVLWAAENLPLRWQIVLGTGWVMFGAWFSAYMLGVFPWAI
jgi:hypothetical protein